MLTWEATPTLQQAPPTHCLYLQAPLFAVLAWDTPTRQRLLFEAFLLSGQAEGLPPPIYVDTCIGRMINGNIILCAIGRIKVIFDLKMEI